jgi:hypothetical protein
MKQGSGVKLPGYRANPKTGAIEKIPGYGLNASAKLAKRKSDKKPNLKRTR